MVIMTEVTTWLNGFVYKEKNGLAYKKKQNGGLMVLYIRKKPKWLTRSRDIFQMAISSFIFNIETSGLKRWKA